jgi:hypothetical protein
MSGLIFYEHDSLLQIPADLVGRFGIGQQRGIDGLHKHRFAIVVAAL